MIDRALAPYKFKSPELVVENRELIEAYLNIRLSKNPESAWRQYLEKMRSLRKKSFRELCYRMRESTVCLYQYKDISAKEYVKTPLVSAMRGTVIKWYENGEHRIMALPFPKFFNYGEVEATARLPDEGFISTIKLDGTLVIVWRDEDGVIHYNTRGLLEWFGVTPGKGRLYLVKSDDGRVVNPYILAFINAVRRLGLEHELETLVREDTTVMFELVGRVPASRAHNSFMIDPDDDSWVPYALAIRDNKTYELRYISGSAFPTPESVGGDLSELIENVRMWKDREGVVLYYPGRYYRPGDMFRWWNYLVKLKSPKYSLGSMIFSGGAIIWRSVARYSILGMHDDIAVTYPETREFVEAVMERYSEVRNLWEDIVERVLANPLAVSERNYIINNLGMRWVLKYLDMTHDRDPEAVLRKLVIEALPRKKEAILAYLDRIAKRLRELREYLLT